MYEAMKEAIQPYLLLLVLEFLVLARMGLRRSGSRRDVGALIALWVIVVLLSMPIVGRLMLRTLEGQYPPLAGDHERPDVIVVMGGGIVPPNAYSRRAQVSGSSFVRCGYALDLFQKYHAPIILCGGVTEPEMTAASEAEVMANALVFLGVPREMMILETASMSTRQNAQRAAEVIRDRGFRRVAVVTHARHMPRTDLCFRKLGIDIIPAPCAASSDRLIGSFDETWIPNSTGIGDSNWTVKEWVALLYYKLRGWI